MLHVIATDPLPCVAAEGPAKSRGLRAGFLLVLTIAISSTLLACRAESAPSALSVTNRFDSYFSETARLQLQDDSADLIGDVGSMIETLDGDLVASDPVKSRILRFDRFGRRKARFGHYGEGPFEFGTLGEIVEDGEGRVVVPDSKRSRVTILTRDLVPDTTFSLAPRPLGQVIVMGTRIILTTAAPTSAIPAGRAAQFSLMDDAWQPVWNVTPPSPGTVHSHPYWDSYATTPAAASSKSLFVAYSLRYPIYRYNTVGRLVDSLVEPPRSFRQATLLRPGDFAGSDGVERATAWLATFDVISLLAVVGDTLLVVTHGVLRSSSTGIDGNAHHSVDVYRLPSGVRIAQDIPLPVGARVLCGGSALYVLTGQPPEPWIVARMAFRSPGASPPDLTSGH